MRQLLVSAFALLLACTGEIPAAGSVWGDGKSDDPDGETAELHGVLTTDVELDLETRLGRAFVTHAPAESFALGVGDLDITRVTDATGAAIELVIEDGQIVLPGDPSRVSSYAFEYAFSSRRHGTLEGYVAADGLSFLWPYFCGNLFPCVSRPSDGVRLSLAVEGVGADEVAVYPRAIPSNAPAYMLAFAVGDYEQEVLGQTAAGTNVSVYYYRGEGEPAHEGVADLVAVFEFLEETYGPYLYGDDVASVSANWGPGDFGGMEHHPYFHVGRGSMSDPVTHAHEAAHGWYGNGVRIRCWEDFVLSEGVTSYLAARALAAAGGAEVEAAVWAEYARDLDAAVANGDTEAWPDGGCDEIDILTHPVWSTIPYMKGAFFLRAVEGEVGPDALDRVLADFYREHGGREAASMDDLVVAIEEGTGFDPSALSEAWLRGLGIPEMP